MKIYQPVIFFSLLAVLAACGEDGFSSTPVSVTAQSGGTVELTGTWKSTCYLKGAEYVIDLRIYDSNSRVSISTQKYAADTTCTTLDSTETLATNARVIVAGNKTALGWKNGSGAASTAPNDTSGSPLPNAPTVSKYWLTLSDHSTTKSIDLIDDATSSLVMYRADSTNSADQDSEGYRDYLATTHPLYKQ